MALHLMDMIWFNHLEKGAERCMKMALKNIKGNVDYINSHGTSTVIGDIKELEAIKKVFPKNMPKISSTKSLNWTFFRCDWCS